MWLYGLILYLQSSSQECYKDFELRHVTDLREFLPYSKCSINASYGDDDDDDDESDVPISALSILFH